jgi:hypothetical protein
MGLAALISFVSFARGSPDFSVSLSPTSYVFVEGGDPASILFARNPTIHPRGTSFSMMSSRFCFVLAMALFVKGAEQAPNHPQPDARTTAGAAGQSANSKGDPAFFSQPPAGVDEALRKRVDEFYQCYVTGEFRKAYQDVADDSKDTYFQSEKTRYKAFKIGRIDYTDNYTRAKVMIAADIDFKFQGQVFPTTVPFIANWKFDNGNWYWYTVPRAAGEKVESPFGPMYVSKDQPTGEAKPQASGGPVTASQAIAQMRAMPTVLDPVVSLNSQNSYSNSMRIINPSPKPMKLQIKVKDTPGLSVSPDALEIAPQKTGQAMFKLSAPQVSGIKQRTLVGVVLFVEGASPVPMQLYVEMLPAKPKS